MQDLSRQIEFSLIRRRLERGKYYWDMNTLDMKEESGNRFADVLEPIVCIDDQDSTVVIC